MTIFAADLPDRLGPSQQINIAGLFLLQLRESNERKSFPGTLGPRNPQSFFEMQLRLPFRARCRTSTSSKADLKLVLAKVLELARYLNTSSSNSFQYFSIYQRNHASSPKLTTGTLLTCVRCAILAIGPGSRHYYNNRVRIPYVHKALERLSVFKLASTTMKSFLT